MYCIAGMLEAHSTKIPNKLYRTFSAQEIPFIIGEKLYPFYWFFWHNFDPTFHHKKANPTCSKISERWKTTDCLTAERQNIFHEKTKDKCQSESFRLNKKGLRRVTDSSPITNFIFAICRYLLLNVFWDVLRKWHGIFKVYHVLFDFLVLEQISQSGT